MFLGIDIGSSSSKVLALDEAANILGSAVMNIGTGTNGVELALAELERTSNLRRKDILYTVVTGYGRMTYKDADEQITEISCHAKGVVACHPEACSIIDIGGQDAKAIQLSPDGRVENFVMNEKCAAGTGRFFEVMARVLNCSIQELPSLAAQTDEAVPISSICTVFAESEVISQLAGGATLASVARGAHISVARRVCGLAKRIEIRPQVVMTGGVALNQTMADCLSKELNLPVTLPTSPQTMGALGAALFAREHFLKKEKNI
ncbi:MAG: 2-hydroxyglutaryl-CoA dehydratase [Flavonifractor sp.]|jgi:predicted CoA-substrate-specific enzyme activase|nr:2-hydroxyglutaryl-CoA dehydratase [Flavonifractor sp.]